MQIARLALVCSALIVASEIRASPPIPDDLSLTVSVVSTSDPTLQPGAHAVLAFDVGQHGPTARDGMFFAIFNTSTISEGPDQPIRLSDAPGSACFLSPLDDGGVWFYSLTQSLPPVGEPIRCLVALDVLPGAAGGYLATFSVEVLDPENGWDPEPGNTNVTLLVAGVGSAEPSPFYMPVIQPADPTIADDIRWVAQWDGCGSLGTSTITRWNDGLIEVRWPSSRVCGVPLGVGAGFDIGYLPAGRYTVHVEPCDVGFGDIDGPCWQIDSPDDVSFTVVGAAASNVPMLSGWRKFALIALVALLGLRASACASSIAGSVAFSRHEDESPSATCPGACGARYSRFRCARLLGASQGLRRLF